MKKIIIWGFAIFLGLCSLYVVAILIKPELHYQTSAGTPVTKVISQKGFSVLPPSGWVLWEGQSAVMEAVRSGGKWFKNTPPDQIETDSEVMAKFQDFITNWSPEESGTLIYTDSLFLDVKSRDARESLAYFGKIANFEANETPPFNIVEIIVKSIEEKDILYHSRDDEEVKVYTINIQGKQSEFRRIFALSETNDLVILRIPYDNGELANYLEVQRWFPKEETDAEQWLRDFLAKLEFFEKLPM
jgi:hypothetical protein